MTYPTASWGPQDVLGAFTIADVSKLNPSLVQTAGSTTMNGKWKLGSRAGVPIALIKDGTSTTMAVAEIIGFDSAVDGRGVWVWPGMGGSIFTALYGPNSITGDTIPACDTNPLLPGPPCNPPATAGGSPAPGGTIGDYASARSQHPGGVNVAMCDGSNHFVTDTIDINVWRAYATRNAAGVSATGPKETPPQSPD